MRVIKVIKKADADYSKLSGKGIKQWRELKDKLNNELNSKVPAFKYIYIACGFTEPGTNNLGPIVFFARITRGGSTAPANNKAEAIDFEKRTKQQADEILKAIAFLDKYVAEIKAKYPEIGTEWK